MKIGDRVTSKKTGLPMTGTIVGVLMAPFYKSIAKIGDNSPWNILYPDWLTSEVYYVQFDSPQKGVSFEEFVHQSNYPIEHAKILYEYMIPYALNAAYPKEDLELINELITTN